MLNSSTRFYLFVANVLPSSLKNCMLNEFKNSSNKSKVYVKYETIINLSNLISSVFSYLILLIISFTNENLLESSQLFKWKLFF